MDKVGSLSSFNLISNKQMHMNTLSKTQREIEKITGISVDSLGVVVKGTIYEKSNITSYDFLMLVKNNLHCKNGHLVGPEV